MVAFAPPKLPRRSAAREHAGQPRRVEDDRRLRLAEPHRECVEAEAVADHLPARRRQVHRRASDPAVQHRAIDSRGGPHCAAGLLRDDRSADRTDRQPRRAELDRAHLQRIETHYRARRTKGEAASMTDPTLDRQPQRLHATVGEGAIELGDGAERRRAGRPRAEADWGQCKPLAAGGIRRELGDSAHRRSRGGLAKAHAAAGQAPARHLNIAVDAQRCGRPIISDSGAAGDPRPRATRPDHVRAVDPRGPASGKVHHVDLPADVEITCGPADRIADAGRDRADRSFGCST